MNANGKVNCCKGDWTQGSNDNYGSCATSSCRNNFDFGKNLNCHNYGSPQHPTDGSGSAGPGGSNNCPYTKDDKAICDVSEYTAYNNKNCRKNTHGSSNHCLGKVKCNTKGIIQGSKGTGESVLSDGTAELEDGADPACSADATNAGFPVGTDCFYDGGSDNWKVCGSSDPFDCAVVDVGDFSLEELRAGVGGMCGQDLDVFFLKKDPLPSDVNSIWDCFTCEQRKFFVGSSPGFLVDPSVAVAIHCKSWHVDHPLKSDFCFLFL